MKKYILKMNFDDKSDPSVFVCNGKREAKKFLEDAYQNCADEDTAENIIYALICDVNEMEYDEIDKDGNYIFER